MKGARPLSEIELKAAADAMSGPFRYRDRLLLTLGCRSGFRISELLSLRVCDVWTGSRAMERVMVQRKNMKRKTEGRCVVLHPQAQDAIRTWVTSGFPRSGDEHAPLFPSRQGGGTLSRAAAWAALTRAFRSAGLQGKLGTHCMRKTFADRVYENLERDIFATQQALGHKNITSTTSYLSFKQEKVDQAILSA